MYSLNHFREKIPDIARPYHFRCFFEGGCFSKLGDPQRVVASLRTANLPDIMVQEVAINYFGMLYKIAGTPTYGALSVQFLIDAEYEVLKEWKKVLEQVFKYEEATGPKWSAPAVYMGNMTLFQLNTARANASVYKLSLAYLSAISPISYNQESKDLPLTFDATISYSYYNTVG